MRRLIPTLIVTFFLAACNLPARATSTPPTPTDEPASTPLPTPTFDPARLGTSQLDVTYCTVDGVDLKMDVYFPSAMNGPAPAVVYVHGGGWRSGDKRSGVGTAEFSGLNTTGFVVFALNYRLAPDYRFPAMIEDVKCAVRSIRAHAAEYNIDPDRIGAFGGSAGGHLVAMLGTTDASAGFDVGQYLEYSSRVHAVVDMFGPTDLTLQFSDEQTQRASHVFTEDQLVMASPVTYITPDDPPFLILQGDKDRVVPPEQSQVLYDRLVGGGVEAQLVMVENAGHGFNPVDGEISPKRAELALMILSFFSQHLQ
ncbi:MAG: alpha/beta hydrolase [Chloroflexota bacterium]